MTTNELPAEPFSVRATEPRTFSHLLASSDPAVRTLAQSIRNEAQAHFATYLEEHAMDVGGTPKLGNEYRIATHRSSLFDPHTHTHLLIANPPTD